MAQFKESFKYYKSRKPPPDLNTVLDLHKIDVENEKKVIERAVSPKETTHFGLIPIKDWKVYELTENPGLIYVKNPFTKTGEKYWTMRSLRDFTRKPNKRNIDVHTELSDQIDWWTSSQSNERLRKKLRWSTLGYHHDWDTKVYVEESKTEFPHDLGKLCTYFSSVLGFEHFIAEAAIVNFYHLDSTLSGHTDHSEKNLDAPLFSFSFGNSAIFLIGGQTLSVKPTALYMHNGDLVVMSGKSRLSYHGVPKIVENYKRASGFDDDDDVDNVAWQPFYEYLCKSRINLNVRQVLKRGQKRLIND